MNTKLKARRMFAIYYPDGRLGIYRTKQSATYFRGLLGGKATPVAVIPLTNTEKMINTAFEAYWTAWALNSATCQQSMHDALAAIGVLPKKGRK